MPVESGERPPSRATRCQLHDSRSEHQTKQKPPNQEEEQAGGGGGGRGGGRGREEQIGRDENRQKSGFQQQNVPLKPQKRLADLVEGKVKDPEQGENGFRSAKTRRREGKEAEEEAGQAQQIHRSLDIDV